MHHSVSYLLKQKQGSVLVLTILILFAVSVIGTTLAMISSTDLKISGNQRMNTRALYVAESGLNEAIHRISLEDPTDVTVGVWTGNAAISDTNAVLDPNWEVRVYLTDPGSAPAGGGSIVTTGTIQDPGNPYLQYSAAAGTDGVMTISHKWEDRNNDGIRDPNEIVLYDRNVVPAENFVSGEPVEIVTVTGVQGRATRIIEAEVFRNLPPITSNTMGAVYGNVQIQLSYNYGLCGYNHDLGATPVATVPMACFAYHLDDGHLPGATNTGGAAIQVYAPGTITGFPTAIDNNPKPFLTCAEVLGLTPAEWTNLIASPDHTSMAANMSGISVIAGDVNLMSDVTGEGLLWIGKKLVINPGVTFRWEGLVYVGPGGDPVQVLDGAEVWIIGSLISGGEVTWKGSHLTDEGILYCAEAIWQIAQVIGSSTTATVLSWREM